MHLVFVTSLVPDGKPMTGYEIANAAIIEGLQRLGVQLTIVGYIWPGKKPQYPDNTIILGEVDVTTSGASRMQKIEWLGSALLGGHTFASAKLRGIGEKGMRQVLAKCEPFDGYVINAVQMAGAFAQLFCDKPSLYIAHNVEYLSAQQNSEASKSIIERILFSREARLLKKMEEKLCNQARFVFTLADEDRTELGVMGDEKSNVLPLVTYLNEEVPRQERSIECDATLVGTWTWMPNRIGLDWFLDEVVPFLPDDFTVEIAGAIVDVPNVSHGGISFVGKVPDAREFMLKGAVAPLISRSGTGVQLKTIEAFELGMPTIATSSALRGITTFPQNCYNHDDAQSFANALVKVARERQPLGDGRQFHASQVSLLDEMLKFGIARLSNKNMEVNAS